MTRSHQCLLYKFVRPFFCLTPRTLQRHMGQGYQKVYFLQKLIMASDFFFSICLHLINAWRVWCRTRFWLQDLDGRGMLWEISLESGSRLWRYLVFLCSLSLRRKRKSQGLRLIVGGLIFACLWPPHTSMLLFCFISFFSWGCFLFRWYLQQRFSKSKLCKWIFICYLRTWFFLS